MSHPRTYTIEDWMAEHHPELDSQIPLEPGMVFWKVTSVVGDGDGFYQVYLGAGRLGALESGLTSSSTDGLIRNEIHTGTLEPVDLTELPDHLRDSRADRMRRARDSMAEYAADLRRQDEDEDEFEFEFEDEDGFENYIERIEEQSRSLDEALDDG